MCNVVPYNALRVFGFPLADVPYIKDSTNVNFTEPTMLQMSHPVRERGNQLEHAIWRKRDLLGYTYVKLPDKGTVADACATYHPATM